MPNGYRVAANAKDRATCGWSVVVDAQVFVLDMQICREFDMRTSTAIACTM